MPAGTYGSGRWDEAFVWASGETVLQFRMGPWSIQYINPRTSRNQKK